MSDAMSERLHVCQSLPAMADWLRAQETYLRLGLGSTDPAMFALTVADNLGGMAWQIEEYQREATGPSAN